MLHLDVNLDIVDGSAGISFVRRVLHQRDAWYSFGLSLHEIKHLVD